MSSSRTKERIEAMQMQCISIATGSKEFSYENYESARAELMSDATAIKRLPEWLVHCRYGSQFWQFIKGKFATYKLRREFIWAEFANLLDFIERIGVDPTSMSIEECLANCSSDSVREAWEKCFDRRRHDPEGAITAARTLVEATCKLILEQLGESPDCSGDLAKLYKQVAKAMNLSPQQHAEQLFKQILSGCGTVVDGLASLRNAFGDAHGHGTIKRRPTRRHADLAVNLAGTLSSFLMATYEENHKPPIL